MKPNPTILNPENLNTPMAQFFELKKAPFPQMLKPAEMLMLPHVREVSQMTEFAFQHNMYYAIIGAVGCGKSSALQYACERMVSRQARIITIIGGMWSFVELIRQILAAFGIEFRQYQPSVMIRMIQDQLAALQNDGKKCIIIIDEAHLLKAEAYAQLHILGQSAEPTRALFSLMLCGQEELAEKIAAPQARPLLSRIAEGYYVPTLSHADFNEYIDHHLALAGAKRELFDDLGRDAIWQCSDANLRSIGNSCLAAMQYAANNGIRTVNAECVRKSQRTWWHDASKQIVSAPLEAANG